MCAAFRIPGFGVAAVLVALSLCPLEASESHAYFARRIWTGQGAAIENGVLVVVDGKVTVVGPRTATSVPTDAVRHDLGDQVIIPGLVVAETSLAGGANDVEQALTPQNSASDGFDFYADRTVPLSGGVTTVQLSPGAQRLMPGVGAVVKLGGSDPEQRMLRSHEGLRLVLSDESRNPPTIYEPPVGAVSVDRPLEPTRPQLSSTLGSAAAGLRAIFGAARRNTASAPTNGDPVMQALASHLFLGGTVRTTAHTAPEIRLALELAREFDLRMVLVDPSELRPFSAHFAEWPQRLQGVVFRGRRPGRISNPSAEQAGKQHDPWESARALVDAGLRIAIRPDDDDDLEDLLFVAGQFRQGDLTVEQTLRAITSGPAEILGVSDRVGTLAKGRDADFVVLSRDPFALHSHVLATYVDGRAVYRRETTERTTVIRADALYTGNGTVRSDATVVVQGKTVRGIGDISAGPDATIRSFPGAVIVPGFVDLGSGLGVGGSLGDEVSLETKLGDQLDATDPAIAIARQSGVTTVLFGSSNGSATPLVAFKLGDDTRVVGDPVAIRFRLGENLRSDVPGLERTLDRGKAYHEEWLRYEKALAEYEARQREAGPSETPTEEKASTEDPDQAGPSEGEGQENVEGRRPGGRGTEGRGRRPRGEGESGDGPPGRGRERGTDDGDEPAPSEEGETDSDTKADEEEKKDEAPKKPQANAGLEPYRLLFTGQIPAFVEARRGDAIEAALELFRTKHDLRTVLIGVDDLARFPDLLDGHDVSVCAGPQLFVTRDHQRMNLPLHLSQAGIPFGFQSRATTGVRDLPAVVQYAVSQGLSASEALQGLSGVAAQVLSDTSTFGALAVGHDADLVVLSGPPFELGSQVLAVMIDGRWVYEKESGR